ncbi:hypothetical protein [Streptomyces natalensis]|uniref:hypothetical protein n=1 Tax=Streptomyces natalensis TaxID=68242 RepID=UPI000ACA534D|nr:hypothetical protein [Streptomyces natalensis]
MIHEPDALAHGQEVAALLPVLAQLDQTATELETGQHISAARITAYETQATHARHLLDALGTSATEVAQAEKAHRGDGDKGFAIRGLDHATHTRRFESTEPAVSQPDKDRDRDDDHDIDL